MYKEFFKDSTWLNFPIFTLLLFVTVFLFVVLRALFSRQNDAHMQALSRMPLEEDPESPPLGGG